MVRAGRYDITIQQEALKEYKLSCFYDNYDDCDDDDDEYYYDDAYDDAYDDDYDDDYDPFNDLDYFDYEDIPFNVFWANLGEDED